MGTGITDVVGEPHDFLPPRSDRSNEFQKLWVIPVLQILEDPSYEVAECTCILFFFVLSVHLL